MVQVVRSQYVNTLTDTQISVLDRTIADTTLKLKARRSMSRPLPTIQAICKQRQKRILVTVTCSFLFTFRFPHLPSLVVRVQVTCYNLLIFKTWAMVQSISWSKVNSAQWWTSLHSLNKGALGELAVQKDLIRQGYNIYAPVVDVDQVDLIVELGNGGMKRVQIKTVMNLKRGTAVEVNLTKYKDTNRIDVVAVYFLPKDIIAYYPYDNKHALSLALVTGKNNQTKGRKWFYSYERFPEFS